MTDRAIAALGRWFAANAPRFGAGEDFDHAAFREWIQSLRSRSRPNQFGLRIGVPDLDEARRRDVGNAVLAALDTALGERRTALEVQHVEVAALPPDAESNGWLALADLPDFLDARRPHGA